MSSIRLYRVYQRTWWSRFNKPNLLNVRLLCIEADALQYFLVHIIYKIVCSNLLGNLACIRRCLGKSNVESIGVVDEPQVLWGIYHFI